MLFDIDMDGSLTEEEVDEALEGSGQASAQMTRQRSTMPPRKERPRLPGEIHLGILQEGGHEAHR